LSTIKVDKSECASGETGTRFNGFLCISMMMIYFL